MSLFEDAVRKRRVFVDGRPLEVPEVATGGDLVHASGHDPSARTVVMDAGDGRNQLVPSGQRIRVKDGQRFETNLNFIGG